MATSASRLLLTATVKGKAPLCAVGLWRQASSSGAQLLEASQRSLGSCCTCRRFTSRRAAVLSSAYPSRPVAIEASRPSLRGFSSTSFKLSDQSIPSISTLSDKQYHEISDETMDMLTETLEEVQEQLDKDDFDVEYSSGVLTVKLPDGNGTYVVNKQPPNKQIWLSSPTSGPKRYDWSIEEQAWFYARDGTRMFDLLSQELSEKLGREVSFKL